MRKNKTVAESLQALSLLDLTNVKRKLMEPAPEGKSWTQEQVDNAEKWYRRFLEVIARFPTLNTVPNYVIDTFWHQHILDTRAYAVDCEAIFGEFIHHYPYFGLNGDAEQRDDCFDETDAAYMSLFGESCKDIACFMDMPHCGNTHEASGCNGAGSGTGCGQGCSRGGSLDASDCGKSTGCGKGCGREDRSPKTLMASGCNSGGSGTGCGQGCGRGGRTAGRPEVTLA